MRTGLVALLALAAASFTAPTTRSVDALVPYEQSGAFAYSAKVPAGSVYEHGTLKPGEPVFLRLVPTLPIRYVYSLESDAIRNVRGTARISGELSDESGWRRVVELGPAVRFSGPRATARGTIDLRAVWRMLRRVQQTTGVRHETYGFALAAAVDVRASASGKNVEERFTQRVVFRLDPLKLQLVNDVSPTVDRAALLRSERGGSVTLERLEPATLSLLGRSVSVSSARRLSAGLGAIWLLALIASALLLRGPAHEPARISSRYASILVPVAGDGPDRPGTVVDVGTIEALVKVAESAGRLVLHRELDGAHTYVVDDDGPVYRFRAYENEDAERNEALREQAKANGNGNGNGNGHHAADRPGFLAQLLDR
jgi:hypothetical protein